MADDRHLDGADLAERLFAVVPPRPIPLPARTRPASRGAHRRPRRERSRRWLALALGASAVATLVAVRPTAGSDAAEPSPSPSATRPTSAAASTAPAAQPPATPGPDWPAVVRRLTATRTAAMTDADPARLRRVYLPGAARSADATLLRAWRRTGERVVGLQVTVVAVRVVSSGPAAAVLRVTQRLSAYRLLDRTGAVRGRSPGKRQTVLLVLVRRGDRWRVQQVRPGGRQPTRADSAESTSS